MVNKNCSASLVTKEMQIKTTKYHFIPTRITVTIKQKQKQKITVGEDVEKLEPLCIASGNVKWCTHCGKSLAVPKNVKQRIAI